MSRSVVTVGPFTRCAARVAFAFALASAALSACSDDDEGSGAGRDAASEGPAEDAASDEASVDGLRIELTTGVLQGEYAELPDGVSGGEARRFLGIPYARPPLGALRWKAPEPAQAWDGLLNATELVAGCPQQEDQGAPASDNEDCLYLNVWSPEPAPRAAPVMVWIHGGGNFSGGTGLSVPSTRQLWYDGAVFAAARGVVVVTIQYRLGPLGFFAHPALAAEGEPVGNQGLQDQRMALSWVRDHITKFGGDPNNVTLFGESAGSADVCYHVASPRSAGLFHRAISQSGGCTIRSVGAEKTPASTADSLVAYGEALGCAAGEGQLECMREAPIAALLDNAMQPAPGAGEVETPLWSFQAVIDGEGGFLPDTLSELFDRGEVNDVPYLLGTNHDEGTTFVLRATPLTTEAEYRADLELRYADAAPQVAALYPASDFAGDFNAARARVIGDAGLVCGTHDTARRAAAAGLPVFLYDFEYPWAILPDVLHAGHAAEISHVFGAPYLPMPDADSAMLADAMNRYWASFAANGDPNGDDVPAAWPAFTTDADRRLHLAPGLEVLEDFRSEECAFWRAYQGAE